MCSIPGLPTPGSEVTVLITRVNLNPSCGLVELWVNVDDGRKHIYEQMREKIQIPERKFYGSEGKPGDLCLVYVSDTWHRARIVSIQSETYDVFLIDQGQPHVTTSETLAWAQSDSFLFPPEIESCILANVLSPENNVPEEATKFLKSLPGHKFKGLVQHVLMPDRTILLDIAFISKQMCKFGVAKKIPGDEFKCLVLKCLHLPKGEAPEAQEQNSNVSCQLEKHEQYFFPELLIDSFETVNVTEVTDPQNIFCKLHIFSKVLKILSEQIHQYYEEGSDFGEVQPQTCGDPCAAKGMSGRWHRSLLKQNITIDDGAVEVVHVDEGKTELVPVGDIRPLYGKFLRMPVVTYLCSLDGLQGKDTGWTMDQTDHLKSLLLNQTVVARFDHHNIQARQDVYDVTLYAANSACINYCFLEMAGLFPPSNTEHDSNVLKESIPSSFLSSLGDKQCMDLQNKVNVNVDDLQERSLPSTKNLEVNGSMDDGSTSGADAIHLKEPLEHPSTGFPSEVHHACDDDVFTVGSGINVKVSCIESLQKFWCQSTENGDSLSLLMQDLQNHYAAAHPQSLVESICVARNPDNNMWYRAKIIASHHSPVVDVRFIDYGQIRKVPLQEVRHIDPAFLRLNAQAFQCCLFNLKKSTYPTAVTSADAALAEFQKFVDSGATSGTGLKCVVKAITPDEEGLLLNMVDIETPSDSACKLLAQKCAQTEAHMQIPPQVPSDAYNYSSHNIEVGGKEKVWVTSSENVGHFYCQLDRNSHLFDKVIENVKQLIAQPQYPDHPLGLNSICFVRYTDNQWHRGQIVEMSPKLKVHFVDYGDTLVVNESDIRPFPTEGGLARSILVQAVPLGLSDVPGEVPQEVNQWFADKAIGHSFTISVVEKGAKGKLIVELFDGSLNVNVKIRERISKMVQQKVTTFIQQTDQQLSNSSEWAGVPNEDCLTQELLNVSVLTKLTEQNKVQSSDGMCARDELTTSSQSISNVSTPEIEHGKTLDEGRQPTLDVILEEKETVLAQTFIQGGHSDSQITQLSLPPCSEGNVNICMYKRPNISQDKTEEVYASCIVGPHYFWCQYNNTENLNMVSMLAQEAGQAQKNMMFTETLGPGSPCLALFSSDNRWYRSQAIKRTDDTLHVLFIDYGNEADVDINNVRELPQGLLDKAPQAFLCSLNGFDESKGTWDDQVYDDFYNLLVDKPLRVTVFDMEDHSEITVPQYAVQIECENILVNNAMQKYWKPVATAHVMTKSRQMENSLQGGQTEFNMTNINVSKGNTNTSLYKKPKISKNQTESVYASCIVEPSFFWCQYANTEDLSKLSMLAQEAGQAQKNMMFTETLGPGSPCLALFSSDNRWYRSQAIKRTDDTLHVLFIDYGNEADVDINNVRELPQGLLDKAPQAFLCSLNGFDESKGTWDDQVYDDFYNLLVDKPLRVTVFDMEDHSEITVPQYAVQIECENILVNNAMQKYWKPVATAHVMTKSRQMENSLQGGQTEFNMTNINVSKGNTNTSLYKKPKISKNQTESVYASCIVEPSFFWCQYANTEDLSKLSMLAQEAGQAQKNMMFPETLGPGSPCLALFSSDNRWYRSQVIKRTDDTLHVLFIDYGNESDVDINNVRELPQGLLDNAPQAFLCSLNGFEESKGTWDDQVYDDFYNLLVDKPLRVTVFDMEDHSEIAIPQYAVQIECENVLVNKAMQKYWKPVATKHVMKESPQTENSLQGGQSASNKMHLNVSEGNANASVYKKPKISKSQTESVYASCIVGPGFFWCQYANTEDLSKLSMLAQEAGQAQNNMMFPETLGPGSPCLALFFSDNQWYRSQVIKRTDDTLQVLFIDYGNEADVDINNVRALPQGLLDKAPQAFLCSLNGFDELKGTWDDQVYDDFFNLLVNKPLRVTVFNIEDHSEFAVSQYAVEVECEGVVVNTLMEKYWKELDTDHAMAEMESDQDETRTVDVRESVGV
ncbi:tudor domain-containing 6 isoform X2 [Seriola aureovittata]|uniref:tudor domain-containing 6 isoform X2 n=1 Tax=Seriola aureovittata TaxID=2871759 RepID=UPI0024BDC431|nr:tudor domain-containing 6 isoform X2 [Seriola aureovittata]